MPKKHVFYGVAALAIIGILIGVISYATDTRKMPFSKQRNPIVESTTTAPSPIAKKKSCGCCADRVARIQEQIKKARERRLAKQQAKSTVVSQRNLEVDKGKK